LSENPTLKLNADQEKAADDRNEASQPPMDDVEAQMRRALGLFGGGLKARAEQPHREPGHVRNISPMKRRFVQEGEVPVTVVRRDPDAGSPSASPLQLAETALANEVSARKNVERLLADTQAQIRDLQTKIGHAELARAEANSQARQDKETLAELRAAADESVRAHREILERSAAAEGRIEMLRASLRGERSARTMAEAKLAAAEDARRSMEASLNELSTQPASPRPLGRSTPPPLRSVARKQTQAATTKVREPEPEPIKWWLTPAKPTKRR
jgi:hypothetical protein